MQMRRKSIRLFASDGKHNLQYEGKCKLQIDRISSMLLVEPEHEEYKIKSAKFECGFFKNKNVLFVVAEQELNDFALIFDEEERCKKVYDLIAGDKAQSDVKEEILLNRFMPPLCNRFNQTDDATIKLKEVVAQLFAKHEDGNQPKEYTTPLNNAFNLLSSSNSAALSSSAESDDNNIKRSSIYGKRRHSQLDNTSGPQDNDYIPKQMLPRTYSQIVSQESYKFVHFKSRMYIRHGLLVFTNVAKSRCYHYSRSQERKLYYCNGCKAHKADVTAVSDKDDNGFDCINMGDKEHVCSPLPYTPSNYINILKKPDYKIFGNKSGMLLIIFDENDKSRCWEFQEDKTRSLFICSKCNAAAKMVNKNTRNEYIELRDASHKCEYIQYEPNKYYHFDDLDLLPKMNYAPNKIIIHPPDFELMDNTENGIPKLFIFDSDDRNLCYTFSFINQSKQRYICHSCNNKQKYKGSNVKRVGAELCKDENGEYFVRLNDSKHACKPKKYEPEKYAKKEIQKCYDYFFFRRQINPNSVNVAIYYPEDKSLCFKFNYDKKRSCFKCTVCRYKRGGLIITRIEKDENGEEYFNHDYKKHVCQPFKVSSICAPKFVILDRSEIAFKEKEKKKSEIDESRIVKSPNFALRPNAKGIVDASLIIFHSEDQNIGYKYSYINGRKFYVCCKRSFCYASAKLQIQENGEIYVILGNTEHKCQPVNFMKAL